ncbi:class I SAM-dependent methyltransferase [Hyphobacterium sp.]|jgi:ubiquinone/menaquinone biosynthesis C-methylase UbiE|uniref:class I SAM-dependent methyltransferase n=1 Tax=Hyphobacterium sp. TaxID=2004662 RepID=UPI003BACFF18
MSQAQLPEDDYIIGASEREIARLGQQHAIWRERALAAWRRGGLKPGMSVLDIGCGPGHASFDLAQLVGPKGEVIAVDQSDLFLRAVEAGAKARGLSNIRTVKADLGALDLPADSVDFIWSRWVLSFLPRPADLLKRLSKSLRSGGVFVAHEYGHYETFGFHPADPVQDRFIQAVKASWRAFGGEPNIAKQLPAMCAEAGWSTEYLTPHIFTTRPGEMVWEWPVGWLKSDGIDRLVELGFLAKEDAQRFHGVVQERADDPLSILTTPLVMEVIAVQGMN